MIIRCSLVVVLFSAFAASNALGMGEEHFGNEPVNAANYAQSPEGLLAVLNDSHRVYHWWVNGNEKFFFQGDTIALNTALEAFATVQAERLEVVVRPGPGVTTTFQRDRSIPYNWHVQLIGGIAGRLATLEGGDQVWPRHPVLHVHIGDSIQLSELKIPDKLNVVQLADLQQRYATALKSSAKTVRGWTCGQIAELDPYDVDAMKRVANQLQDADPWVRLNAAGALASFKSRGLAIADVLEAATKNAEEDLQKRVASTLASIRDAEPEPQAEAFHQKQLLAIEQYVNAWSK